MILADKIIMLRKKNGWSQEELAEKLDVSRQSVSKWEGGLSVPDLNKIIGMSALFGVSTDYLLKDELEQMTPSETGESDDAPVRQVTAEDANHYMDTVVRISKRMAIAVMLCILSPVGLIFLAGLIPEDGRAETAVLGSVGLIAIGMILLFLLVGAAVAIFIPNGMKLSEFSYLETERFTLAYGVKGIVEKRKSDYTLTYRTLITVGIVLCIFSAVPLLVFGCLEASDLILVGSLCFILIICAVAVALIVRACYINGSFERLLQTGDFTEEKKHRSKETEVLETAYWGVFTALYLGISFLTAAWHLTWIIWIVAGCLFPVVQMLFRSKKKK